MGLSRRAGTEAEDSRSLIHDGEPLSKAPRIRPCRATSPTASRIQRCRRRASPERIPGRNSVGKVIKAEIAEPAFVGSY